MSMKPIRDFVVVSAIKADAKTASGLLYTPETVDPKIVKGKVLAVGSGHLTDSGTIVPLEVQVGDTVMFSKSASVELEHQGEKVFLLHEESILTTLS